MPLSGPLLGITRCLKKQPYADVWKVTQYGRLADTVVPFLNEASTLMDLGCGEGLFSYLLERKVPDLKWLVGMDIDGDRTRERPRGKLHYVIGDAGRPPFAGKCVDVVIAKDLLHHMDDPSSGIRSIVDLAKQRVVIIEANLDNPVMAFYRVQNGDAHMSTSTFEHVLKVSAPQVEWKITHAVAYPFYLPPTTDKSAVWVWPITAAMILLFKVLRSAGAARLAGALVERLHWAPPFSVAVAELGRAE